MNLEPAMLALLCLAVPATVIVIAASVRLWLVLTDAAHLLTALAAEIGQDDPDDCCRRVDEAVAFLVRHWAVEGAHHKQWVLDQTLRLLTRNSKAYGEATSGREWDRGIAP